MTATPWADRPLRAHGKRRDVLFSWKAWESSKVCGQERIAPAESRGRPFFICDAVHGWSEREDGHAKTGNDLGGAAGAVRMRHSACGEGAQAVPGLGGRALSRLSPLRGNIIVTNRLARAAFCGGRAFFITRKPPASGIKSRRRQTEKAATFAAGGNVDRRLRGQPQWEGNPTGLQMADRIRLETRSKALCQENGRRTAATAMRGKGENGGSEGQEERGQSGRMFSFYAKGRAPGAKTAGAKAPHRKTARASER